MRNLWQAATILTLISLPTNALPDGINHGLQDPLVAPVIRDSTTIGAPLAAGSNHVGSQGGGPDQIYGYDVDIAYDHLAVGVAILAGLFVMTEWMERR